jgi:hypothetical protein
MNIENAESQNKAFPSNQMNLKCLCDFDESHNKVFLSSQIYFKWPDQENDDVIGSVKTVCCQNL